MKKLEVCCGDIESVYSALRGGADRIELCTGLESGGLTPSLPMIREAVRVLPGKVNVLIRPRSGDFLYSEAEKKLILEEIALAVEAGATGIVCGGLTEDGMPDMEFLTRMINCAGDASFTFHRAFDMVRNPEEALELIAGAGADRILTSGCAVSALEGVEMLRNLQDISNGRVIILAGAGVGPSNVRELISRTGVGEVHASCKERIGSGMIFRNESVSMGLPGEDEFSRFTTSEVKVRELAGIVHSL